MMRLGMLREGFSPTKPQTLSSTKQTEALKLVETTQPGTVGSNLRCPRSWPRSQMER